MSNPTADIAAVADLSEVFAQISTLFARAQQERPVPEQQPRRERILLTVEEAAEQLGIGRTLTYTLVKQHKLPSIRIGRLRRIHIDAVRAFAASLAIDPTNA